MDVLGSWRSSSRALRVAAIVVFAALGTVGFLPLFGGPGYEQSLASGLVVPAAAAIATAIELSGGTAPAPLLACIGRGILTGVILAGVAFTTALLHGARVGICDFWGGAVFFLLTAGVGAMMGGAWGALVAEVCRGRRRRKLLCVLLAIAGPIGGIVVSVARFVGSPMIFAYDPFFGYFSGTLYDTVVDVRPELWTYRAGSIATLVGLAFVAAALERGPGGRPSLRRLSGGTGADGASVAGRRVARLSMAAGVAALAVSLGVTVEGAALGHWQTATTIARSLGGRKSGPRCDVVFPDSLSEDDASLLVRDCEQELTAVEGTLGVRLEGRLTAFVFGDSGEKRRLMGAADTSIAKPWRREVYVQLAPYPHPVLGHEIAHVVAGTFARWPFRVGGGVLPNPGLIEGLAVATSPDDDELTGAQWARAMLDLGTLPPVRDLFSLQFLGVSAQKSYTVAGAFVAWVRDRWGAEVVRAWYGGGSIEALTGEGWPALEADFRASLRALRMPRDATAYARAKFERPSVWARRCPHVVDALNRDADRCRDEHRLARADALYARALTRDPRDYHALMARAKMAAQSRDPEDWAQGREQLEKIAADEQAPRTWRDRAEELLADDDLVRGRAAEAATRYREIADRTLDEDAARTLEVKALAAEDAPARRAIVDLLLAEPGRPQEPWLGALSLGRWMEGTKAPLAEYLAGKNLMLHEEWGRAGPELERALASGELTPRVSREVLRQRAIGACVLGDTETLHAVKQAVLSPTSPFAETSGGRSDSLLRLLARCEAR
ncbi:MAG TPA: hypothetical protein VK762_08965 [Polyangiaceae bacterium]|nr:hypothetical protein [Polyangiaceae bacterium]